MSALRERMRPADQRRAQERERSRKLAAARRAAQAEIGCDICWATRHDIATEQHRLRATFYERNPHLRTAVTP